MKNLLNILSVVVLAVALLWEAMEDDYCRVGR
jgi:hypothetical protein